MSDEPKSVEFNFRFNGWKWFALFTLLFITCVATGHCTCGGRDYVGEMIDIHRMERNR